jgi:hypothetical protein
MSFFSGLSLLGFLGDLPMLWWVGLGALFLLIVVFIFVRKSQSGD